MVAAPALPPQVFVPERARTRSEAVRHRTGRPSTLRLVTTGLVTTVLAESEGRPDVTDAAFQTLPALLAVSRIRVAASPRAMLEVPVRAQGVRLTLRGRVALGGLTLLGALGFLSLAHTGASDASSTSNASLHTAASVTVHDGDTLWAIANRVEPGSDPRSVIDRIRSLNKLDSAGLEAGQTLRLR
jgi:hypothetical protein